MNAARAPAAATANIVVNEQLTAAESAVAQAASHLELMRKLAGQALVTKHHVPARPRKNSQETQQPHGAESFVIRLDSSMPRIF